MWSATGFRSSAAKSVCPSTRPAIHCFQWPGLSRNNNKNRLPAGTDESISIFTNHRQHTGRRRYSIRCLSTHFHRVFNNTHVIKDKHYCTPLRQGCQGKSAPLSRFLRLLRDSPDFNAFSSPIPFAPPGLVRFYKFLQIFEPHIAPWCLGVIWPASIECNKELHLSPKTMLRKRICELFSCTAPESGKSFS